MSGEKTNTANFSWPIRVYYEDTDAGGIVYYANYLKFLERARTEWLRSLGIEQDGWLEQGIGFVVRQLQLDLLQPARFNEQLLVTVQLLKLGRASIECQQQVRRASDGALLCQAQVKAACVQLGQQAVRATAMPAAIYEVLKGAN